jgi:PKD domain-containing protein
MVTVAVTMAAQSASGAWILIWHEDYTDCSDWSLTNWICSSGALRLDSQTNDWFGPAYRNAGGSVWDRSVYNEVRIEYNPLYVREPGVGVNSQFDVRIENGHAKPDSGLGNDYLEIQLSQASCCSDFSWNVKNRDDGGTEELIKYPIPEGNIMGYDIYSNITINIQSRRFWINWTTYNSGTMLFHSSGAITGQWNNSADGWYAEATTFFLNIWGYSSQSGSGEFILTDMNFWGNDAPPSGASQQGSTAVVEKKHRNDGWADFGYSVTELGTQFYDVSQPPGAVIQWTWDFGDGYGSMRQHPFHSYMCEGNYTVTLEVVDEFGNWGAVSAPVYQPFDRPLCGVLTKGEEGLKISAAGHLIEIPTALFIFLAAISAATLFLRIDPPFIPRGLRWFVLFLSLVMLALTLGAFGSIATV